MNCICVWSIKIGYDDSRMNIDIFLEAAGSQAVQ
jgi:hypothetical protein